jgi:hypothetical protein
MNDNVTVEVIGLKDISCGPFPCDDERSCGLDLCHPTEKLVPAFHALKERLEEIYQKRVVVRLTLIDDGVPDRIHRIIEEHQPPLPIVLVNGNLTPIGRISLPLVQKEIEKYLD